MKMPKTRKEYEWCLLNAYSTGMNDGYAIEHTDIVNEERKAEERFLKSRGFRYTRKELIDFINHRNQAM